MLALDSSPYRQANLRRCAFSSSQVTRSAASHLLRGIPHGLFTLLFPDDCRVCKTPLLKWTRVPVCDRCLHSAAPLDAEYFCAACNTPFANRYPLDENGLCTACRAGLIRFDRAACFGFYEGSLRTLIHLYKYAGMRPLARHFAGLMDRVLPREVQFDVVVPVPLHWRKQWARGFNQAELLARELARRHQLPTAKALRRKRATAVQASLASAGRRRNVAGAFTIRDRRTVEGARVLLIDDVMTTGATANACATALKIAGAKSVTLLTLARVDRRWRDS